MAHYPSQSNRAVPTADPGLELRHLDDSVQKLFASGLSSTTIRSYRLGCSRFALFCNDMELSPFPPCESTLCRFVAFLVNEHLTLETIRLYLSMLRLHQIEGGGSDHSMADMPPLHYVLRGAARTARGTPHLLRLPITIDVLVKVFHIWKEMPNRY